MDVTESKYICMYVWMKTLPNMKVFLIFPEPIKTWIYPSHIFMKN